MVASRPPAFYVTMTPKFATEEYQFPAHPHEGMEWIAEDQSRWVFGTNILYPQLWEMTHYPPTGDPYFAVKQFEKELDKL